MRAIIDQTGYPEAESYYRMFPLEPAARREDDMRVTIVDPVANITMERVLDRLTVAARAQERVVMIVAHGRGDGFIMPIAAGGVTARRNALLGVMRAAEGIWRRYYIRHRPADERLREWTRYIRELAPDAIRGEISVEDAERWFQDNWLVREARNIRVTRQKIEELVTKMNRVQGWNFARIEIRACNMGADQAALETLRQFLGAQRICAPNVGNFYVAVRPYVSADGRRRRIWARRHAGPVRGGVYRGRRGPRARTFDVLVPAAGGVPQGFVIPQGFTIRVWETQRRPIHRYASRAAAASWNHVRAWVDHNIMPRSGYRRGRFFLAGMWTFGPGREPFVTPLDPGYRRTLVCAPAGRAPGRAP